MIKNSLKVLLLSPVVIICPLKSVYFVNETKGKIKIIRITYNYGPDRTNPIEFQPEEEMNQGNIKSLSIQMGNKTFSYDHLKDNTMIFFKGDNTEVKR